MDDKADDKPAVVIVDDHDDEERGALWAWDDAIRLRIRHPRDVQREDLRDADLVLVDFQLNSWRERDELDAIALQPLNGLALCSVLRAHAEAERSAPVAFALRSAHLKDRWGCFPPEPRLHTLARRLNLEWVFPKGEVGQKLPLLEQITELAMAVRRLPRAWPTGDPDAVRELVEAWLRLPDERWSAQAWRDIEECHPPIHELEDQRHGLLVLRWFLHLILPYPCFLWNRQRLAGRLRVTRESLDLALESGLSDVFDTARYGGQLRSILGERWWRSGCETILWDKSGGQPFDSDRLRLVLNRDCKDALIPTDISQPVVCLDENFQEMDQLGDIETSVRIQPDDWPPFADQAWATTALASAKRRLRSATIESDRERLVEMESEA